MQVTATGSRVFRVVNEEERVVSRVGSVVQDGIVSGGSGLIVAVKVRVAVVGDDDCEASVRVDRVCAVGVAAVELAEAGADSAGGVEDFVETLSVLGGGVGEGHRLVETGTVV